MGNLQKQAKNYSAKDIIFYVYNVCGKKLSIFYFKNFTKNSSTLKDNWYLNIYNFIESFWKHFHHLSLFIYGMFLLSKNDLNNIKMNRKIRIDIFSYKIWKSTLMFRQIVSLKYERKSSQNNVPSLFFFYCCYLTV